MTYFQRTKDYIEKLQQLCVDIQTFVEGIELEEFLDDRRTQNAVAMSLIAIGEIVTVINHKDPEFIANNSQIPWRYMKGMRNVIAHGYFELDFVVVWETAISSIPELQQQLNQIDLDTINK
ncbi:hypothetical protein BMT54_04180 [Pasteurellaceae bacterium 15-036681]|nr:hypothetical protein BMT54_04180 [Pasteurellaceae bacterium 15-036681]